MKIWNELAADEKKEVIRADTIRRYYLLYPLSEGGGDKKKSNYKHRTKKVHWDVCTRRDDAVAKREEGERGGMVGKKYNSPTI